MSALRNKTGPRWAGFVPCGTPGAALPTRPVPVKCRDGRPRLSVINMYEFADRPEGRSLQIAASNPMGGIYKLGICRKADAQCRKV